MSVRVRELRLRLEARAGWLVAAGLALAVGVVFAEPIFGTRVFYQRDIHWYWYPHRAVIERALGERSLPLWNAFVGFGAPLFADPNFLLAYPPTWLALLLPAALHYELFAIGHTLLAAAGAWALARRLGHGVVASGVAGGVFALSGPLLSSINLLHHPNGAAWLPWVLWALEGLLLTPGRRSGLALALTAAAQVLAGSGDMCLFSALLGGARIAWGLAQPCAPRGEQARALLRHGAPALVLALALSALQWLPTADLVRRGARMGMDQRTASYWSVHPASLADLVVPRLVADLPLSPATRAAVFEGRGGLLNEVYLGIVPLALALLAVVLGVRGAPSLALGLLSLLTLSLGRYTPLYGLLFRLPGFDLVRYPTKLLIPAALCVALLAARGATGWGRSWTERERRRGRWLAVLLVVCALAVSVLAAWLTHLPAWFVANLDGPGPALDEAARGLAAKMLRTGLLLALVALLVHRRAQGARARWLVTLALLVLGAGDGALVGRTANDYAPATLFESRPRAVDWTDPGFRNYAPSEPDCLTVARGPAGWKPAWTSALGVQETLRPPVGARWGLFGSFDGEFTSLGSSQSGLLSATVWQAPGTPQSLRLLQSANVGRVFHLGRVAPAGLLPLASLPSPFVCPLLVLRVPNPLPRAYVVRSERRAVGAQATLDALLAPAFDPAHEVVLEEAGAAGVAETPVPAPAAAAGDGADDARVVGRTTNTLEVQARLAAPGTLVVVEGYDPGWRALVDGRVTRLLRANGLFRAVRLSAGEHRVRFEYRPWAVPVGASLSALGLLVACGIGWTSRRS